MQKAEITIPPDAFTVEELPPHLRPTFRIVGDDGTVLGEGDDLATLKNALVEGTREMLAGTSHELEQRGLTAWSFGRLPERVEIAGQGHRADAYPALVDEGDSVAIRLLATEDEQAAAMVAGTRRLLLLNLPGAERILRPLLTRDAKLLVRVGPYDSPDAWVEDCLTSAAGAILRAAGGPVWDAVAFDALLSRAQRDFAETADRVARQSLDLLATLQTVYRRLEGIGPRSPEAQEDIAIQLDRLVYPGFLTGVGAARVRDVHRYLQAIERRLDRLPDAPEKDAEVMARIHRLEAEHDRLLETLPPSADLIAITWQLEELRVSLFAQSLGTAGKVSEKRIGRALADVVGGAAGTL
jgi:ATP-dependent helicase HrpA